MKSVFRNRARGYTLIELLAVMAIIAVLIGLSVMGVGTFRAHELAGAADQLAGEMAHALQLAAVQNEAVEMRFYEYPGADDKDPPRYRGFQLVARDSTTGEASPLDRVRQFGGNIVLHPDPRFTTLFTLPQKHLDNPARTGVPKEISTYVAFRLLPEGTTSLTPDLQWSLTLVFDAAGLDRGGLPGNYRSVVISPVTGGVRVY